MLCVFVVRVVFAVFVLVCFVAAVCVAVAVALCVCCLCCFAFVGVYCLFVLIVGCLAFFCGCVLRVLVSFGCVVVVWVGLSVVGCFFCVIVVAVAVCCCCCVRAVSVVA